MTVLTSTRSLHSLALSGVVVVAGYVLLVQHVAHVGDYSTWSALVVIPPLILLNLHLLVRLGRRDPDPWVRKLLLWAFAFKCAGIVARYFMTFVMYDGTADAGMYHAEGARIAASYRAGDFDADIGRDFVGTGFIRVATGVLYSITGPSMYVAYTAFGLLGFWGLYFLYRAFRIGIPTAHAARYGVLVFFLPSMVFWPSSLGKDAWMTFSIGLAVFGAARLLAAHRGWLIPLVLGLTATACVRPPITAALFAGIAAALVMRRPSGPRTIATPLARLATLVVLCLVGAVLVNQAAHFMGVESVSASELESATDDTLRRTSKGGSEFDATPVTSPFDLPWAAVTVIGRPFLFEAHNYQNAIAALEGTLLLILSARAIPRLRGLGHRLRSEPYLILCLVYTLLFIYGYSNIANFGILTRQRVQVLPFVLVFLALPLTSATSRTMLHRQRTEELRA